MTCTGGFAGPAASVGTMENDLYPATRRCLHAVAERLLAGPQFATAKDIRLRPRPGGFGTVASPDIAVLGTELVVGDLRQPLSGRSIGELAAAAGVTSRSLSDVYRDVTDVDPDDVLVVDPEGAERIAAVYAAGDAALRSFAPQLEAILWPEHFDLAIEIDQVNYGVSPGDAHMDGPYMYVGPWSVPPLDDFWNASFGAARPMSSDPAEVVEFFAEGRSRLTR